MPTCTRLIQRLALGLAFLAVAACNAASPSGSGPEVAPKASPVPSPQNCGSCHAAPPPGTVPPHGYL